jgi:hypothetical protein
VQPSSLRSDCHTAFSQDVEHRRLADPNALSHLEAREPGHVEVLDPFAVSISDPVLRWTRRTLTRADGTEMERNRGVALQLGEGYQKALWNRDSISDPQGLFASSLLNASPKAAERGSRGSLRPNWRRARTVRLWDDLPPAASDQQRDRPRRATAPSPGPGGWLHQDAGECRC